MSSPSTVRMSTVKTYLILEDSVYFQCNNITEHSDHNAIATVKHLIHYVDSIRKYPGTAVKTCTYLIEKDDGCNHMKCKGCGASYCWHCEQDWKLIIAMHTIQCLNQRETHEARKQRFSKLNQELEALLFPQ